MIKAIAAQQLALAVAVATLLGSLAAHAHQASLSYGEVTVHGAVVEARLRFAATDLAPLLQLDQDGDGKLTQRDLDLLGPALPKATIGEMRVRSGGADCTPSPGTAQLEPPDGIVVTGRWTCPAQVTTLEVRAGFVELLAAGHTHLARISFEGGSAVAQRIAQVGQETYFVEQPRGPGPFFRLLLAGLANLAGGEHLAFLLGLLLLGGGLRTRARIVLAFAVAHSIGLALAALDLLLPPARLVGPLIAASLIYVAAENLWALRARAPGSEPLRPALREARVLERRWLIAFGFGLAHGFGLAERLAAVHLPDTGPFECLVGFNLGTGIGLGLAVAAMLALLAFLRRQRWFPARGVRTLSAAIGFAGLVWLVQRIAFGF